jgi:hypothetical protein
LCEKTTQGTKLPRIKDTAERLTHGQCLFCFCMGANFNPVFRSAHVPTYLNSTLHRLEFFNDETFHVTNGSSHVGYRVSGYTVPPTLEITLPMPRSISRSPIDTAFGDAGLNSLVRSADGKIVQLDESRNVSPLLGR